MTPDLVVLARELPEVQLVAEVKVGAFDRAATERQLKKYMWASNCAVGLLITPTTTWLLRDSYEDLDEDAIVVAGEYATSDLLDLDQVPSSERELEDRVFMWLESLAASGVAKRSRGSAREDVSRYLLPAVVEGRVYAEASS
jgi:hypothetical protein